MSKEKFIFDLKMSMQLFYFNDELYFNRDLEYLEERASLIYADLFEIVNIGSVEFVAISKNTCDLDSFGKYSILFNIHLHFINGEIISVQKCLVCNAGSCFKI